MKHIKPITTSRADAFTNFMNAVWRHGRTFATRKKNEVGEIA